MNAHPQTQDEFHTTRWSLIRDLEAGQADSRSQLNELCLRYWGPIHQYVRHCGHDELAARALSRDFFEHLLRDGLSRASRYRRFREFLQAELDAFLAGPSAKSADETLPPLSVAATASAPARSPESGDDRRLQRGLALEVISLSRARLRAEAADADRLAMYERLQRYLSSEARPADIEREAAALGAKTMFVTMAIRRLRQRFRRIVDDELARLVTDPAELAEEREAMLAALDRTT